MRAESTSCSSRATATGLPSAAQAARWIRPGYSRMGADGPSAPSAASALCSKCDSALFKKELIILVHGRARCGKSARPRAPSSARPTTTSERTSVPYSHLRPLSGAYTGVTRARPGVETDRAARIIGTVSSGVRWIIFSPVRGSRDILIVTGEHRACLFCDPRKSDASKLTAEAVSGAAPQVA